MEVAKDGSVVKEVAALAVAGAGIQHAEVAGVPLVLQQGALVDARKLERAPFTATALGLASLTGLLDYAQKNVDGATLEKSILVVAGPSHVHLMSALREQRDRETLASAQVQGEAFAFGQYQEQTPFVIGLMTRFVATPARDLLVQAVSKIVAGEVIEAEDDGVGQKVTLQKSAGVRAAVALPPIQKLQPFRTFREVEQPESPFLLRVKAQEGAAPQLALFNADGGEWLNTARLSIKAYLEAQLAKRKVALSVLA